MTQAPDGLLSVSLSWRQSCSDEDRIQRLVGVFRHAGMDARLAGRDVRATT
jgi:hypothetical protein